LQLGRSRARGSVEPGRESAVIGVHARSDLADRIRLREEIEKLERRGTRRRICGLQALDDLPRQPVGMRLAGNDRQAVWDEIEQALSPLREQWRFEIDCQGGGDECRRQQLTLQQRVDPIRGGETLRGRQPRELGIAYSRSAVCTENLIRFDLMTESL